MFLLRDIHKTAKEYIVQEILKCDNAISNHSRNIEKCYKLIEIYKTKTAPNIVGLIDNKYIEIDRRQQRISFYKHRIKVLNAIPVRRLQVFSYILRSLNANVIREVLKGGKYVFPLNMGKLYIIVTDKYYGLNSIDWGKSMRVVHNIAKEKIPELYKKFKNKEIFQFEYMAQMREHLYPTPGKPRWLIYNDDNYGWYIVHKRGAYNNKNKYYFKFKGTYYVTLLNKSLDKLGKYFNSSIDVINSKDLGFINKVLVLKRYFNELKIKYNDISVN